MCLSRNHRLGLEKTMDKTVTLYPGFWETLRMCAMELLESYQIAQSVTFSLLLKAANKESSKDLRIEEINALLEYFNLISE